MRYVTTAAAALIVCVLMATSARAQQQSFDEKFQSAQVSLDEHIDQNLRWAYAARISLIIVISVGLLGIVTAGLQATSAKWKGIATAVVGGLISGATVFSTATIPADYKTLDQLVAKGGRLIKSAQTWIDSGRKGATDAYREYALNEVEKRLVELSTLTVANNGPKAPAGLLERISMNGFVAVLHASEIPAPGPCGCFKSVPQRKGDLFACGTAAAASLKDAHELAVTEAAKEIASQLRNLNKGLGGNWSDRQLVDYVSRVATEFDSCPGRGPKPEIAVMLRLPESLAREQSIVAFGSRSKAPATVTVSSIKVIQDGSAGDTGWMFDVMVDGRLVTRIPARDYHDRPAASQVMLSGANVIEAPVDLPKGSYWLVEIKGQRTKASDTAIGGAARRDVGGPVQEAGADGNAMNGSFVFTVSFAKNQIARR